MTAQQSDVELGQMARKARNQPTPSATLRSDDDDDDVETNYQPINWKRIFWSRKYTPIWVVVILVAIATALITVKHDQVVATLRPWSEKVRDLPAGWLIPIAILFAISFPPLFGHELVALLCGIVYGLWIGFAVVSAGTFLGEVGTWYAFKYLLRNKAAKMERSNLSFAALARLTRDGGFWIVLVIRFSAIPSHFSTAVFSTCGVKFWHFAIATLLTMPKQLFLVYLGVLLLQEQPEGSAKNIVFGLAFVVTIIMAIYIYYKMQRYRRTLLEEQDLRRIARNLSKESPASPPYAAFAADAEAQPLHASASASQATLYPAQPLRYGPDDPGIYEGPSTAQPSSFGAEFQAGYDKSYPHDQFLLAEQSRPSTQHTNRSHLGNAPVQTNHFL